VSSEQLFMGFSHVNHIKSAGFLARLVNSHRLESPCYR